MGPISATVPAKGAFSSVSLERGLRLLQRGLCRGQVGFRRLDGLRPGAGLEQGELRLRTAQFGLGCCQIGGTRRCAEAGKFGLRLANPGLRRGHVAGPRAAFQIIQPGFGCIEAVRRLLELQGFRPAADVRCVANGVVGCLSLAESRLGIGQLQVRRDDLLLRRAFPDLLQVGPCDIDGGLGCGNVFGLRAGFRPSPTGRSRVDGRLGGLELLGRVPALSSSSRAWARATPASAWATAASRRPCCKRSKRLARGDRVPLRHEHLLHDAADRHAQRGLQHRHHHAVRHDLVGRAHGLRGRSRRASSGWGAAASTSRCDHQRAEQYQTYLQDEIENRFIACLRVP